MSDNDQNKIVTTVGNMGIATTNIQKLNGNNFLPWKRQVTILLKLRKLEKALTEDEVDEITDMQAVLILLETMDDSHKIQVQAEETARAIMLSLERQYANNTVSNKFRLLSNYFKYTKSNADTVSQHIGKMKEMRAALANLKETHSDDMFQVILIQSLPDEYGDIMRTWEITHPTLKTLELLYNLIQQREEEMKKLSVGNQALLVGRSQQSLSIEERKKISRCGKCNEKGHWWRECQVERRTDDRRPREPPRNLKANILFNLANIGHKFKDVWLADSGASAHMCNNRGWFKDVKLPDLSRSTIEVGNGDKIAVKGIGNVELTTTIAGEEIKFTLKDVLWIPDLSTNLLSIGAAAEAGLTATFGLREFALQKDGRIFLTGERIADNLYRMNARAIKDTHRALVAKEVRTYQDWHEALGHPSDRRLKDLLHDEAIGIGVIDEGMNKLSCGDCPVGKGVRASHPVKTDPKATQAGDKFHVDLSGQVDIKDSLYGYHYYLLGKDEATEFSFVEFVKFKHEVPASLAKMFIQFEAGSSHTIKTMISDRGSEFVCKRVEMLLTQERTRLITSAPYTPQQNGMIEREMRTITEAARVMLLASGLPKHLWPLAVMQAVFLKNRLPTKRGKATPFERFTGRKPYLKHLAKFGEQVQISDTANYLYKFSARTIPAYIVGHTDRRNTYLVYIPSTNHVRESCDVFFRPHKGEKNEPNTVEEKSECTTVEWTPVIENEGDIYSDVEMINTFNNLSTSQRQIISTPRRIGKNGKEYATGKDLDEFFDNYRAHDEAWEDEQEEVNKEAASNNHGENQMIRQHDTENTERESDQTIVPQKESDEATLVTSNIGEPGEVINIPLQREQEEQITGHDSSASIEQRVVQEEHSYGKALVATGVAVEEPKDYQSAINGPDNENWSKAVSTELEAHKANGTWTVVRRPEPGISLTSKWVFTLKRDHLGHIERYKARLVARGFQQREGVDYGETFAPVARTDSLRAILAMSVIEGWEFAQFDVSTAFLNGKVEEEIYIEPPEGVDVPPGKCLKLKKALYGLKQAPRCWNSAFDQTLKDLGFRPLETDPCVYMNDLTRVRVIIYVDDGLVFGPTTDTCEQLIGKLNEKFQVKQLSGDQFLGIQIERNKAGLRLSQERYVHDMCARFEMSGANSVSTPIIDTRPLMDVGEDELTTAPYRSAIGCLQYLACCTRPDLLFAVNFLARFNEKPERKHWEAVKRVLQYTKGTADNGIVYTGRGRECTAFSDADWANSVADRKSVSGTLVLCAGGPVCFSSRKQNVVAQSTAESEYIAANEAAKDISALLEFASELKVKIDTPILFIDNQSTVSQITNIDTKRRSKHIEVKYHYIRNQHQKGSFNVKYIPTENQLADYLTKPISGPHLERLKEMSGVKSKSKRREVRGGVGYAGKVAMLLLTMMALGAAVEGAEKHLFAQQVDPLQWTVDQRYRVDLGTRVQTINLVRFPTCSTIPKVDTHKLTEQAHKTFKARCETSYAENTLKAFLELAKCFNKNPHHRGKREVILLTIVLTTALVGLGYSVYGTISNTKKINSLQEVQTKLLRDIQTLHSNIRNGESEHNQTLILLSKVHNMTRDNEEGIINLGGLAANWAWDGGELNNIIERDTETFKELTRSCRKGRVSMDAMRRFVPDPTFELIDEVDTHLEDVVLNKENKSISMLFTINEASRDTKIYKAVPFNHYVDVMSKPRIVEYHGPVLMIHNSTSNCSQGIDEPARRTVHLRCDQTNYRDHRLDDWRPAMDQEETKKRTTPRVERMGNLNFIYCLYNKITVGNQTTYCIDKPFALPTSLAFRLPNYIHNVTVNTINAIEGEPLEIPTYKETRYVNTDHERFMTMLHNVQQQNEKALEAGILTIDKGTLTVPLDNAWVWTGLVFLALVISTIIVIGLKRTVQPQQAQASPTINVSNHHEHNIHYATPRHHDDPPIYEGVPDYSEKITLGSD